MNPSRRPARAFDLLQASDADLDAVQRLLSAADLPLAGLNEQFPAAYVIARSGESVVGVAGLERYGAAGLLRSVAVAPDQRCAGIGRRLVTDRLRCARQSRLASVYLLTTTAADYFARFGFVPASRADAPAALSASEEFARACPDSAACLVWRPDGRQPASFATGSTSS